MQHAMEANKNNTMEISNECEVWKKHKMILQNAISEVDKEINKADKAIEQKKREGERLQAAMNRRKDGSELMEMRVTE